MSRLITYILEWYAQGYARGGCFGRWHDKYLGVEGQKLFSVSVPRWWLWLLTGFRLPGLSAPNSFGGARYRHYQWVLSFYPSDSMVICTYNVAFKSLAEGTEGRVITHPHPYSVRALAYVRWRPYARSREKDARRKRISLAVTSASTLGYDSSTIF